MKSSFAKFEEQRLSEVRLKVEKKVYISKHRLHKKSNFVVQSLQIKKKIIKFTLALKVSTIAAAVWSISFWARPNLQKEFETISISKFLPKCIKEPSLFHIKRTCLLSTHIRSTFSQKVLTTLQKFI